jgi:D-xylose transport system permease protein
MAEGEGTPPPEDLTEAAAAKAALIVAPEIVANSFGEYVRGWWVRIRGGESGVLPVLIGLVLIGVIFQTQNSSFLSADNLTNLLVQAAAIVLLAMGEIFALLLGEIDLSIGFVSGISGVTMTELSVHHWGWGAAVLLGLLATTVIGLVQGTLITRLRLPSFVVTLAGLLGWQGVMIKILGPGGTIGIPSKVINDFAGGNLTVAAGWIFMLALVGLFAAMILFRDTRRRASGLVVPPFAVTLLKIGTATAAGVVLVLICNADRGRAGIPLRGVPWAVLIVLGVLGAWTFLLNKTRFGRYVYAIGGNPEAARRAGVSLPLIRTVSFGLVGLTAGIAGVVYASRLQSVSTSLDGGNLVLLAVASAVIGGTSLFGGRGKVLHAVLGGIVITAIANGMGLLGLSAAVQYIVTALVLLAAVTVDSVARRGRTTGVR